jgi:ABC-type lipoprotein export system ATPase subunit
MADEPTGNLDSKNAFAILDLLKEIHSKGKTIFLITHEMAIAKNASRIISMQDGKIV